MKIVLIMCLLLAGGWYGYKLYQNNELPFIQSSSSSVSIDDKIKCITKEGRILYGTVPDGIVCERRESVKSSMVILLSDNIKGQELSIKKVNSTRSTFQCDGRTYCSQMNSKAEAEFFSRHCPNTKMDGDNDGIPCESDSRF